MPVPGTSLKFSIKYLGFLDSSRGVFTAAVVDTAAAEVVTAAGVVTIAGGGYSSRGGYSRREWLQQRGLV
jgi:hypothetical protein